MMGVPKEEIDQILKNEKMDMRIIGFDEEEKRIRQRMSNGFDTPLKLPSGNYVFGGFKTLDLPGIKVCIDSVWDNIVDLCFLGKIVVTKIRHCSTEVTRPLFQPGKPFKFQYCSIVVKFFLN